MGDAGPRLTQLWDGKHYHRDWLELRFPDVLRHADANEILMERQEPVDDDFPPCSRRSRVSILVTIGLGGFGIVAVAFVRGDPLFDAIVVAVVFMLLTVGLLTLYCRRRVKERTPARTISISDGIITVDAGEQSSAWPLTDCQWFVGSRKSDSLYARVRDRNSAVIVITPPGEEIACGLHDSTRCLWRDFLQLAGVVRVMADGPAHALATFTFGLVVPILVGTAWHVAIRWYLLPLLAPADANLANRLTAISTICLTWAALVLIPLALPHVFRDNERELRRCMRISMLLPVVMLGMGRRGLGLGDFPFEQRTVLMIGLSTCFTSAEYFLWTIRRWLKQRSRGSTDDPREP